MNDEDMATRTTQVKAHTRTHHSPTPMPQPKTQHKVWTCKIGYADNAKLPDGADAPMRAAIREAYYRLTGTWPEFIFSGWGGQLTDAEKAALK